ncbi:MAG: DedA family protein [Thermoleophilia bacterium]
MISHGYTMNGDAQHYINLLAPYVDSYGYFVAFFGMMIENAGIPVPAETALITLSFFASQGVLKIWWIIPIAILGDTAGDNIGYAIGRFGGRPLVDRFGRYIRLDAAKLDRMEVVFQEKGGRTVYLAHFLSSTRISAALIAGVSHMRYPRFLAVNAVAAATFVSLVAGITYAFGSNLDAALRFFRIYRWVAFGVLCIIGAVFLYRFHEQKKDIHNRLGLKIIVGSAIAVSLAATLVYFAGQLLGSLIGI